MERLTFYLFNGAARLACKETCGGIGTPSCEDCPTPCYEIQLAFNKLAAYEDTGLTPEEIKRLASAKYCPK